MIDEIERFAQLKPTEPHFSVKDRALVRARVFGDAGTSRRLAQESDAEPTPPPSARPRRLQRPRTPAVAAAVIAAVGLGGIWAVTRNDSSTPSAGVSTTIPGSAASSPDADALGSTPFVYQVSSFDGTVTVTVTSIDETGVCFTVTQQHQQSTGCADADTIATGLAWGMYGEPDGGSLLVGVVPDAVDTVEVNGQPVNITGNVWSTRVASPPIELRIGDSTRAKFVSTTIGAQPSVQTTTTIS